MTPSTPNQPAPAKPEHSASPGALRAVAIIRDALFDDATIGKHSSGSRESEWAALAGIIDRETNHAEMLHALKLAHELLFRHPGTPEHGTAMTAINRAIRNATK